MQNKTKRYSIGHLIEVITSLFKSNKKSELKSNSKKKKTIWYTWK